MTAQISSAMNYFNRNRSATNPTVTQQEIEAAIDPLTDYFNANFAIMNETLTHDAMMLVMTRCWKEVLQTIEAILVPPMSDRPSAQKPLTRQELDIVYQWLDVSVTFFPRFVLI